ncbi:type II DNA topoisomerase [Trametes versicolor FP-101664 SS1]|uniref:type II DNA topoisomerase n=1 Tax=Trametes versicolor (strain FP-101664) TaxID=717944 RepID=UPI0004621E82|nr:type II DNA topoisomerase [Trametes versicolor FP-101664 SS1]EIW65215.1 type II DNA topoisomerase [Trametes versicolor FP-101664 SS1]
MSSSEENFDLDVSGSESDGYAPAPKKKAPAKKPVSKAAPKAATKPKVTKKTKVLLDKNDNADSDEDEDPMDEDPASAVAPLAGPSAPTNGKKKTASEMYTKLSQLEHILKRPDSYIGSVETITQMMWTWDSENKRMVHREIKYVPGFFKIVDEILVNAADNKINDASMDTIKVNIDVENNTITVYNNGRGIPIEMHKKEKIYIPELIFGHLLSSSNYDDDEKKLTGGRNGYGAKLANIYSTEFTVDTADKNTSQKYSQTWTENMSKIGKAKITKNGRGEEYTRVTFKPDLKRFGMDSIDEDTVSLLKKRVHDLAGTTKDVKVFLNDERLKIKNFKQYVELFINSAAQEAADVSGGAAQVKPSIIYEPIGTRWEVAFAVSDGSFQQVSFANSISTSKGGTHVNYMADQIAKALITSISKKNKAATIKPAQIKNHMWIFVNALIENPTFDSQTKETLTLPASKFGTRPTLSEDFMKKVAKSSIVDHVLNWAKFKADQQLKKTDGNRRTRLTGMTKLSDANNAGTRKAGDCTLILTEGDSARALAIAGLGVVGRDNFGVFPLRGKLLNVRDAKHDQIMKNEEIQNIKKIMGLQHNKEYTDVNSLRYGRLMLMTDQDHDGSHIKGLLINYLDHFYPSLLKLPKFLVEFITPVVRVWKGKTIINFYTIPEYEMWLEDTPDSHKWEHKYYKGLGTSKDEDARDYFRDMKRHMIPFSTQQDGDRELIELAFSKKKADDRKEWLRQFKPGTYLDHTQREIPLKDFINRELILFSMADNIRSIPSVADGLKPGQRKVIWSCFKRNLKREIKVAQLVGYVSETSAYHHGEASLMATIINLAQDYVGSNNMNLLLPNGQFGTRDQGGKDHAAARYIYTELAPVIRTVMHPADDAVLSYQQDDGRSVEPEWYMPVIPLVLVNGAEGIGTGWSTSVPSFNPEDIVANLRRLMNGEEQVPMLPWWRGFSGAIKKTGDNKYDVLGTITKVDDSTIEITELPIHKWTQTFKAELEVMCGEKGDGPVKDYKEYHNNMNVHFVVTMTEKGMEQAEKQGFHEFFKLTTKVSTANMVCFDFDSKIKKYSAAEEIIEDFYPRRLAYYQKRKDFLANELQTQLDRLNNQARFVKMIIDKELIVNNRKKADIVAELRKKQFRPFPKVAKAKVHGEIEDVVEDEDGSDFEGNVTDYDYLLGMAIWSLTKEKIDKLLQQAKEKETELLTLLELTPIQIWQTDLDAFLDQWKTTCIDWEAKLCAAEGDGAAKKGKKKAGKLPFAAPKKTKAEEDDDFKPGKATAKARKASETKKPTTAVPSGSNVALKKGDDDDDDVVPPPPPKKRAAPAKKVVTKIESDSDLEMVDEPPPKPAAKRKAPVKAESDSEFETPSSAKGKGKAKAKNGSATKRKSLDAEIDDSDDELSMKPPPKKKKASQSPPDDDDDEVMEVSAPAKNGKQAAMTDFFGKAGPAAAAAKKPTARKVSTSSQAAKSKAAPPVKRAAAKKTIASDNDFSDDEVVPAPPKPRAEAPKRATRGVVSKYVEITSGDEDDGGSNFEDFD